jgi:hypothetical protein
VILSSTRMATRSFSPMPRKERSGEETLTGIGILSAWIPPATAARMIINLKIGTFCESIIGKSSQTRD